MRHLWVLLFLLQWGSKCSKFREKFTKNRLPQFWNYFCWWWQRRQYLRKNHMLLHKSENKVLQNEWGKASALNFGCTICSGICCMYKTQIELLPDAVSKLMMYFSSRCVEIGWNPLVQLQVIVKVGNQVNLLTKWRSKCKQSEFWPQAFAYINAITVVPGAIGVFVKKQLKRGWLYNRYIGGRLAILHSYSPMQLYCRKWTGR